MGKKAFLPARVLSAAGLAPPMRGRGSSAAGSVSATSSSFRSISAGASSASAISSLSRSGREPSAPVIARRILAPGTVVLGIDPGTILVGYGALEVTARGPRFLGAGVVRPDRKAGVPERLGQIQREVLLLLQRFRPSVVVVERAFAARNVQSALRIGEARGVILACAASSGAAVAELSPASAKKAVVGHGGAAKIQVAKMAAAALGLRDPPQPLDASDALALALAHTGGRLNGLSHGRSARER